MPQTNHSLLIQLACARSFLSRLALVSLLLGLSGTAQAAINPNAHQLLIEADFNNDGLVDLYIKPANPIAMIPIDDLYIPVPTLQIPAQLNFGTGLNTSHVNTGYRNEFDPDGSRLRAWLARTPASVQDAALIDPASLVGVVPGGSARAASSVNLVQPAAVAVVYKIAASLALNEAIHIRTRVEEGLTLNQAFDAEMMYQKAVWWAWAVSARDEYRTQLLLSANTFLRSTWDAANRAAITTTPHHNVPRILIESGDILSWRIVAREGLGGVGIPLDPDTMRPIGAVPCTGRFRQEGSSGSGGSIVRLGSTPGIVQFQFDGFDRFPDSFRIVDLVDSTTSGRVILASNGPQLNRQVYSFAFDPLSYGSNIHVLVTGHPDPGTRWEWRISCPGQQIVFSTTSSKISETTER